MYGQLAKWNLCREPGQEQGENSAEGCFMVKMVDIQIHAIVLETLEAMPAFKPPAGPAKVLSVLCFYVYCCGIVLLQVISARWFFKGTSQTFECISNSMFVCNCQLHCFFVVCFEFQLFTHSTMCLTCDMVLLLEAASEPSSGHKVVLASNWWRAI